MEIVLSVILSAAKNLGWALSSLRARLLALTALVAAVVAACSTGAYQVEIFPEQHYQQSTKRQEPPRLYPPEGAVPITGRDLPVSLENADKLQDPLPILKAPAPDPAKERPGASDARRRFRLGFLTVEQLRDQLAGLGYTGAELDQQVALGVLERGAELFRVNCSVCHGPQAKGDGPAGDYLLRDGYVRPPNLTAQSTQSKSDGAIFGIITNGVVVMPRFGLMINDEGRWSLVQYLRYLAAQSSQ